MRICHVIEAAGGGSGQVVLDLLEEGLRHDQDLTLVYAPNRADAHFQKTIAELALRHPAFTTASLPMQRAVGPHDLTDAWKLYKLLRRLGPFDVVHSHSSKAGALARLVGLFLPRTVQIYTPHAFMTLAPGASPIYGWIEWGLSWLCDAITCTSAQEKQHGEKKLRIRARKLHVIPNGIRLDYPADRETARRALGFADDCFVVGFVGRLVPQKNPARLVEAFAQAAAHNPQLRLAIVGNGELLEATKADLKARGLEEKTALFTHHKGRDLMPGFDVLLCASDYEGFALILLEALAAGVPIVTTPVGGAIEAVIPQKTGAIASDFHADRLAEAILEIATLPSHRRDLFIEESRHLSQSFTTKAMYQKMRSLYERITIH